MAATLAGCAAVHTHRGAVIDPTLASAIQPGVDNKASVEKLLGRPSFTGEFTPDDWYYVSRDTDQFAFRNPRVTEQTVLLVQLRSGRQRRLGRPHRQGAGAERRAVGRKTPTLGRKQSFFEELFGNIGTVGAPGLPGANNGPGY